MTTATILPKRPFRTCGGRGALTVAIPSSMFPRLQQSSSLASVLVPGIARDIQVKFASSRWEWEEAFQLVADNYQARGYEEGNAECRFTNYHALPDTVVVVAKAAGQVVATFSLVADNTLLGLPLEGLYGPEIQQLRRQGRRLFEVTCLAGRKLGTREFHQVFLTMMRLSWQFHDKQGGDGAVITVNPRHSAFYTRLHGFMPLGPRRSYDAVQGHPAEAFFLDPPMMAARVPETHHRLFGETLPAEALQAPRLPAHLACYFASRSSQTHLTAVQQILKRAAAQRSLRRW